MFTIERDEVRAKHIQTNGQAIIGILESPVYHKPCRDCYNVAVNGTVMSIKKSIFPKVVDAMNYGNGRGQELQNPILQMKESIAEVDGYFVFYNQNFVYILDTKESATVKIDNLLINLFLMSAHQNEEANRN